MIGVVVALLLAGNEATLDVSDHTEARVRVGENLPGVGLPAGSTALDLVTTPRLYYELASPSTPTWRQVLPGIGSSSHRWKYTLSYTPIFMVEDVANADRSVFASNSGVAAADWRGRSAHLLVRQEASYGSESTAYIGLTAPVAGAPPQQPALVPTTTTILAALSRSTAIAEYRLAQHWMGGVLGEYLVTGGVDAASQVTVPLQYGPRAELSATYAASRRGYWITTASGQIVEVEYGPCTYLVAINVPPPNCAPQSDIALAKEAWRYYVSRSSYTELGAGASVVRSHIDHDVPYNTVWFPTARATYAYAQPNLVRYPGFGGVAHSLRVDAVLEPFVDYRGLADNRFGAAVTYGYVNNRLSLTEQISAGVTSGTFFVPSAKTFTSRTALQYAFNRHLAFDTSLVYAWVDQAPYGALSSGYMSFGLTAGTGLVHY
jgi:hypothetical protein